MQVPVGEVASIRCGHWDSGQNKMPITSDKNENKKKKAKHDHTEYISSFGNFTGYTNSNQRQGWYGIRKYRLQTELLDNSKVLPV